MPRLSSDYRNLGKFPSPIIIESWASSSTRSSRVHRHEKLPVDLADRYPTGRNHPLCMTVAEISVCACSCQPRGCFLAPRGPRSRGTTCLNSVVYRLYALRGTRCLLVDLALIAVIVNSSILAHYHRRATTSV